MNEIKDVLYNNEVVQKNVVTVAMVQWWSQIQTAKAQAYKFTLADGSP